MDYKELSSNQAQPAQQHFIFVQADITLKIHIMHHPVKTTYFSQCYICKKHHAFCQAICPLNAQINIHKAY